AVIDRDCALVGIVETTKQLEQRALAGAIRTDNRDDLSGRNRHREIVERFTAGVWVSKGDAFEIDAGLKVAKGWGRRVSGTNNLRLEREEFEQVAQEEAVGVELACILEQCAHQSLSLIECCVDQCQLTESDKALQSLPYHISERSTDDEQSNQAG